METLHKIVASFYLPAFTALTRSFLTSKKVKNLTLWSGKFIDRIEAGYLQRKYTISTLFPTVNLCGSLTEYYTPTNALIVYHILV